MSFKELWETRREFMLEHVRKANAKIRSPEYFSKLGKLSHKKNPGLASKRIKKLHKVHKKEWNRLKRLRGKERYENDPEHFSKMGVKGSEATKKKYPHLVSQWATKGAIAAMKKVGCWHNRMYFGSKQERDFGLLLIEYKLINEFKEGVNCHIVVDGGEIDFKVGDVFIEFHPCRTGINPESFEEYYAKRRMLLDDNGYVDSSLVVVERLKDINKVVAEVSVSG